MALEKFIEDALQNHKIPREFSAACLAEANSIKEPTEAEKKNRVDLRHIPFVTIDGDDSKDFDDAVYAERWGKDGYYVVAAIADVSYYVRPGTVLDDEAQERGTSAYFPNKCIPMLPENLSNNICSLKPQVDRLVIVKHLYINATGELKHSRTEAAVIHSHARLTYTQVQTFLDGNKNALPKGMLQASKVRKSLKNLSGAYHARLIDRHNRFTAEFNSFEKCFTINRKGRVSKLEKARSFDSNKLIEESMVLPNYDAGKVLDEANIFCANRVHHNPENKKRERLQALISEYNLKPLPASGITPELMHDYVAAVPDDKREAFQDALLLTSEKAYYTHEETGHFGLALPWYAHFTSPIRRYPDILVHRAHYLLYKFPGWEDIGILPDAKEFARICEQNSESEKNAQKAGYEVTDRLTTSFYKPRVNNGAFVGTVAHILVNPQTNKAKGVFVNFDDGLGKAYVTISNMKDDSYKVSKDGTSLIGTLHKKVIKTGSEVNLILIKADEKKGQLAGIIVEHANKPRNKRRANNTYKSRIGQKFNGEITDIFAEGLTVTLEDGTETSLHVSSLKDCFYVYCNSNKTFTSTKLKVKKVYKIGDKLEVKLIHVHPKKGHLKVELATN
ncbi:MAG: ribonuclease R [Alphaproteobacteria bacterium]|jgi:ribonuclease R